MSYIRQYVIQKLNDLENRLRQSNLCFVAIPEYLHVSALTELCAQHILEALGLPAPCTMEHAHLMGAFATDRKSPRPIIAKYLNYSDKAVILQKYRQSRSLQIDGVKVLIFTDYSIEVSKKEKPFNKSARNSTSDK